MKFKKILKKVGKNLLAGVIGGIIGAVISVFCGWNFWLPNQIESLMGGLETLVGAIALILITIILFSILGIIFGGILGIVIYNLFKIFNRKNSSKSLRILQI
jgi:uncharacterized PurR-regulated membrane protein YhhQ (DUF165 family)